MFRRGANFALSFLKSVKMRGVVVLRSLALVLCLVFASHASADDYIHKFGEPYNSVDSKWYSRSEYTPGMPALTLLKDGLSYDTWVGYTKVSYGVDFFRSYNENEAYVNRLTLDLFLFLNTGTEFTGYQLDDQAAGYNGEEFWKAVKLSYKEGSEYKEVPDFRADILWGSANGADDHDLTYYGSFNVFRIRLKSDVSTLPFDATEVKLVFPTCTNSSSNGAISGVQTVILPIRNVKVVERSTSTSTLRSELLAADPDYDFDRSTVVVRAPAVLTVDDDFMCNELIVEGGQGNDGLAAGVLVEPSGRLEVTGKAYFQAPAPGSLDNRNLAYLINQGMYEADMTYFCKTVDCHANKTWATKYGYYTDRGASTLDSYNSAYQYVSMPTDEFSFYCYPNEYENGRRPYVEELHNGIYWYANQEVRNDDINSFAGLMDDDFKHASDLGYKEGMINYACLQPGGDNLGKTTGLYNMMYANGWTGLGVYDFNTHRNGRTWLRDDYDTHGSIFAAVGHPHNETCYSYHVTSEYPSMYNKTYYFVKNPYPAPIDWRHVMEGDESLSHFAGSMYMQGALGLNNCGSAYNVRTGLTTFDSENNMQRGYIQPGISETRIYSADRSYDSKGYKIEVSKKDICSYKQLDSRYIDPVELGLPFVRLYCEDPDSPKGEGNRSVCVVYFLPYNPISSGNLPGYANIVNMLEDGQYTEGELSDLIGADNAAGYRNPSIYPFTDFRGLNYFGYNRLWESPFALDNNYEVVPYRFPYIGTHSRYLSNTNMPISIRAVPLREDGNSSSWTDVRDMFEAFVDKRQTRLEYGILDYGNLGTLGFRMGNLSLNATDDEGKLLLNKLSDTVSLPQATETTEDNGIAFDYTSTKESFYQQFPDKSVYFVDGNTKYSDIDAEKYSQMGDDPVKAELGDASSNQLCNVVFFPWQTNSEPCIYQVQSVDADGNFLRDVQNCFDGNVGDAPVLAYKYKSDIRSAKDGRIYRYKSDDAAGQTLSKRGNVVKVTFEDLPVTYAVHFVKEDGTALQNANFKNETQTDNISGKAGQKPICKSDYKKSFTLTDGDNETFTYVCVADNFDEVELAENPAEQTPIKVTFRETQNTAVYTVKFLDQDGVTVTYHKQVGTIADVGGHPVMFPDYKQTKWTSDKKTAYFYLSDNFDKVTIESDDSQNEDKNIAYVNYLKTDKMRYVLHFVDEQKRKLKADIKVEGKVYNEGGDYSDYTASFLSDDLLTKYVYKNNSADKSSYRLEEGSPTVDVNIVFAAEQFTVPYTVRMVYVNADDQELGTLPNALTEKMTTVSGPAVRNPASSYDEYTNDIVDDTSSPKAKYVYKGTDFGNVVKDLTTVDKNPALVTLRYTKIAKTTYTLDYYLRSGDKVMDKNDVAKQVTLEGYEGETVVVGEEYLRNFELEGKDGNKYAYTGVKVSEADASSTISSEGTTHVRIECDKTSMSVRYKVVFQDEEGNVIKRLDEESIGSDGHSPDVLEVWKASFLSADKSKIYEYQSDNSQSVNLSQYGDEAANILKVTFRAVEQIEYHVQYRYADASRVLQPIKSKVSDETSTKKGALLQEEGGDYSAYTADIVESDAKYVYKSNDFSEVEKTMSGATVTLEYTRVPSVTCKIQFRLVGDDVSELKSAEAVNGYVDESLVMKEEYKSVPEKKDGVFTTQYVYSSNDLSSQKVQATDDLNPCGAIGTVRFTATELCDFTVKYVCQKPDGSQKSIKQSVKRERKPKATNPVTEDDKETMEKLIAGKPTGYQYVYVSDDYDATNVPNDGVVTVKFTEEKKASVGVLEQGASGFQAYGGIGNVTVSVIGRENISIYSLSGVKIGNFAVVGQTSVGMPAGIYIVKGLSGQSKVVVR